MSQVPCDDAAARRLAEKAPCGFTRVTLPTGLKAVSRQNSKARAGSTPLVVSTRLATSGGADNEKLRKGFVGRGAGGLHASPRSAEAQRCRAIRRIP
jgi:hypothetical protein